MPTEVWKLPVPATSLTRDPAFTALAKRRCEISFQFEGGDGATNRTALIFNSVEAYKCTYLTSCSADMFNIAYAKLVDMGLTPWLTDLNKSYRGAAPVKDLEGVFSFV
jgi:hypothetical protein